MTGKKETEFDMVVVGGGPAGATAALYASRIGLRVLLVDKEQFPRDKVCGDALSGKSVGILRDLDLLEQVRDLPGASVRTITFGSPNHTSANILMEGDGGQEGFVIRRKVFDNFLFQKAGKEVETCIEGFFVRDLITDNGHVCGIRGNRRGERDMEEYRAPLVLGADGFSSVVARKAGLYDHDPRHWVVALRCYYRNVGGLTDQIELHYLDEVIPGYFWIFPLEDGRANVGIGMLHEFMKCRKVNLKESLRWAINSGPFRDRFSGSEALEEPVGWNLPVGSKHRTIVGDGLMLLGDAAGLIDPFTGEGIGNAMYSARVAVETAREAHEGKDFGGAFLSRYDRRLWDAIGPELKLSTRLQQLGRLRFLLNFVIGKAARHQEVRETIGGMITNELPREKLASPVFYLKLLFT
ncbi:MAG: NAD(P)/FAD-dependent oxidoreductase [Fidelibacterota bacterium]